MAEERIQMTEDGLQERKEKLEYLKTVRADQITRKIAEARSQGDLSENAEYDAAKEEEAKNAAEIKELETLIRNADIVDSSSIDKSKINIGANVVIRNMDTKKDFEFTIVGSKESDILKGKMSSTAPVGAAIMEHKEGETVIVELPNGTETRYKIKSISYPRKRATKKK
ncbi:MAG: transcription elongation factor GreA [Eubacterium sp.]|nr:transcription elongation factor GreA [Eubacterium sp.]